MIQKEPSDTKQKKGKGGQASAPTPPVFGSWDETPSFGRAPVPSFGAAPPLSSSSGDQGQGRGQTDALDRDGKQASVVTLLILCIVVIGILGGLVLLRTGGKLPGFLTETRPAARPTARASRPPPPTRQCANILRRYRYAVRMEKKTPRKWKKWRKHWASRAHKEGCSLP